MVTLVADTDTDETDTDDDVVLAAPALLVPELAAVVLVCEIDQAV